MHRQRHRTLRLPARRHRHQRRPHPWSGQPDPWRRSVPHRLHPFYKYFQTAVKCCSQGGVRGGAATLFYPLWHTEVESLLVLKNNRGVEENRVRHMDYGVQINKLMYQRLIKGGDITLFSPSDAPGLYDAFFADQDKFEALYVKYEQDRAFARRPSRRSISSP